MLSSDEEDSEEDDEALFPVSKKQRKNEDVSMPDTEDSALWGDLSDQDEVMVRSPLLLAPALSNIPLE